MCQEMPFLNFGDGKTANSDKPTPELCFLPGRLRWTIFLKSATAIHSVARGSNTQPSNWEAD